MNQEEKQMFKMLKQMFHYRQNSDFENLVKQLFELQDYTLKLKSDKNPNDHLEELAKKDLIIQRGQTAIVDVITQIGHDPQDLFQFAYQLRKQDVNDEYTWDFLNGAVQPSILVSMIMSNKWDATLQKMSQDPKTRFVLLECLNNEVVAVKKTGAGCS